MSNKNIGKIFSKILLILIIVGLACGLIYIGFYLNKISKKQYVFGVMIDKIFDKSEEIIRMNNKYILGDNFSVTGKVDLDLKSEEYTSKSLVDVEYLKKNNVLKNLSLMDINFEIKQDKNKGRGYAFLDEKIGTKTIFSGKYLIDDSTKYFLINGFLNNYVNDGGNAYFESLTDENTTYDNIEYLYDFIRESLKENILEDDLKGFDTETNIGDERRKVSQISLKVTNKTINNILSGILNDIKKDERSSMILDGVCGDSSKLKYNSKKKYLNSNESYTINIYTQKVINKPLKYEIIYLKDDQKEVYTYEGDENSGDFYYLLNNEIKYNAKYDSNSKQSIVNVTDRNGGSVGTIKAEKDSNNFMFTLTLDLEKDKYDILYSRKFSNLKEGKEYDREDNLSFKIMNDMVNKINGSIKVNSKISSSVKINEDLSTSILRTTLTDAENESLKNLRNIVRTGLEK